MTHLGLLIAAFVILLISSVINPPRVALLPVGLALFVLAFIFSAK